MQVDNCEAWDYQPSIRCLLNVAPSSQRGTRWSGVLALALAILSSCSQPAAPDLASRDLAFVAFTSGEHTSAVAVDTRAGKVVARLEPNSSPIGTHALAVSPDTEVLYLTAVDSDATSELLAVDARAVRVAWEERLNDLAADGAVPGLHLEAGQLGISPDGRALIMGDASQGGTLGLAVVDLGSRTPVAFVAPFAQPRFASRSLPAGGRYPNGAIVMTATRTLSQPASAGALYVLDGKTLSVRDSIPLTPVAGEGSGGLAKLVLSPDGTRVYVVGPAFLYVYGLAEHRLLASTARPSFGDITISPDGTRIYVTDPGDGLDSPGSGFVFEFDAELDPLPAIDLRTSAAVKGLPPRTISGAISGDGTKLFLTSGSAGIFGLFPLQPDRLLTIDLATGAVIGSVLLGDLGAGAVVIR